MIRFKPAPCLFDGHLQTLYPAFFSKPFLDDVQKEIFELDDGDFVELVWYQKPKAGERKPIMILFHGLAGSFDSPYIKRAMLACAAEGYAVVLMHFRGCGEKMNRLPRAYHSGDTADARALIEALHVRYHDSTLFATGYSLGGNMLLKLLGEWGEGTPLKAAMVVSAPIDLASSADYINRGFSKVYQARLMRLLNASLEAKYAYHDMEALIGVKKEEVKQLRSFWEFDDAYTAPIHGFKDAREYYEKCSAKPYLKDIMIDTLLIHAKDDPFMGDAVIPKKKELSDFVQYELSASGGHVGFVSASVFKPHYWLETRMLKFFATIRAT